MEADFSNGGGKELFNLKVDPMEKLNVYKKNIEMAGLLRSEFMEFEKNCKKFSQKRANVTLDEKELEELRTLGYIK